MQGQSTMPESNMRPRELKGIESTDQEEKQGDDKHYEYTK
jgi:hypothetical protein